ncbi:kelch-like protein 21 [Spea bombifrons]|uniref:kelch-like protein 21 n=1 Tax=Spea bombifrons TaxID=233779 RepID=UPI00234B5E11|nr:kelch-like protein 21 [Spea bombifrons]XP_053308388.1 kelch-like protein 21 [Spea bombifrons]XP_053308389.1 kelch-like protein 21 [Spea bombifrons]
MDRAVTQSITPEPGQPEASISCLPFYDSSHALRLLRGIHELRAEHKFFDMTVSAGGQDFPCHRTVLAAASNYFRAMFAGRLRESQAERVELHQVTGPILGLLLDFCYSGRVTVTQENVELLLQAADLLQFPSVKEACCAYLEQQLDISNCLEIQDFAEAYACRGLAESTKRFILAHMPQLAQARELERLPWKRLLEFIRDDRLCVDKEEAAYQLAVRWVRADLPRRQHRWPELFQHIRLPFIRRFYLLAHVESEPLVYLSPACLKLVGEARAFQSCEYDRHDRPCERMRPRPSTGLAEILVVIGGCDQDCDELVTVDCYNPHSGQWRYLAEFPEHLGGGYSMAALGNDIYVTGGSDGSRLYDCVWRYNSSVNEWTEVSPMLKPREYHSSTVLKGLLYVIASDSTERYDHSVDSWESLRPMLYPMDNCSTTSCRGRLYAIGSLEGKETMVMQCYDPDTDLWTLVNCGLLPPWSFAPKTVTLNGLIYFVRDDSAEVDVYSPMKNEWDKIPAMKQVHVGGSLAALGGKLYVSGGYDNTFELSDVVEAFDPETRTWNVVGRLPQPTFWHGSVSIFRQFMPHTQYSFDGVPLDNANHERNTINLNRRRQHLHNHNLNELHRR